MSTLSFPYSPLVLALLIAGVLLKPLYAGASDNPHTDTEVGFSVTHQLAE